MTTQPIEISAERVALLRAHLKRAVDDGYFAGITACAVQCGTLLHEDAFGFRDVEERTPMTTDTIFRIASSTKPIIGVGMMLLFEEGQHLGAKTEYPDLKKESAEILYWGAAAPR